MLCICINIKHIKYQIFKGSRGWESRSGGGGGGYICIWCARAAMSNRMVDGVFCLTLFITDHLFPCLAAETDGGAAGGGVWRQAESVAWETRAGVQTAEHPGPGTFITPPLVSVGTVKCAQFTVRYLCFLMGKKTALESGEVPWDLEAR